MPSSDTFNRGGFQAFLFSMVVSISLFIYVVFIYDGVNLKEIPEQQPGAATQAVAQGAAPAADISKIEKPWVDNPDMVAHGKVVFQNTCAVCHGPEGKGDGPAGQALNPRPRNLVEGKWLKGGDKISLYTTIEKGLPGTSMAAFGHLPKADRWALVQYIESITQNKGKDDPAKVDAFAATAK